MIRRTLFAALAGLALAACVPVDGSQPVVVSDTVTGYVAPAPVVVPVQYHRPRRCWNETYRQRYVDRYNRVHYRTTTRRVCR